MGNKKSYKMSCVSFLFFSAGCQTSVNNQILNNTITRNLTNYLLTNRLGVVNQITTNQQINVTGDIACRGDLNITNRLRTTNTVTSNFNAQSAQQFKSQVATEIRNGLDNYSKSISELLSQAGSNLTFNDIRNLVDQTIETNLTAQQLNDIANTITNNQVIELKGISANNCNIINDAEVASFVQATLESINTAILNQENGLEIANALKNVTITEQRGFADILRQFGIWIVLGIVVFLIIIGVFFYMSRSGGGTSTTTYTNK